MYLDALSLSSLVDEFLDTLVGGRIQDVLDVDATGIGLEIYANRQRRYLYLSADKQAPRLHLVGDKLRRGLERPTQLGLMFRRYIQDGRLTHVSQPPWERIVQLHVESAEGDFVIVVEPMERRSNILLLRDGIILDCMWRVGPDENRHRLSLPNHVYQLPPPMSERLDPFTVTAHQLDAALSREADPKRKLAGALTGILLGFSPLLAKEVVFRAQGDVNAKAHDADPFALHGAIQAVCEPLQRREWQPGVVGHAGQVSAYSVYPLRHLESWRPVSSLSEAMSAFYGAPVGPEAYAEAKRLPQQIINETRKKLRAKLTSLESGLKDESELLRLQQSGELILAYQYAIERGQTTLKAQYDFDQPELEIALDPQLTPLENAQRYFDQYQRAKRAQEGVPQLIQETRQQMDYLAQLEHDLSIAANWNEIDEVMLSLHERGWTASQAPLRRRGGKLEGPLRLVYDGYVIWVGRNSRQNETVTFKNAKSDDLWLHARDVPGAHVVIRNDGRRISDGLIQRAAAIAAYYSAKRQESRVVVDVTRCKYVKKIKGGGPGMVTYRNETTVTVAPHNEEILSHG
ncbi:MAG: NFACT family protein [Anaerolineae bacterium]|nr:NFACT family protein [Anaerolineae bacterium]MDW8173139.1 NFACT RNA binding domain-containing protein [Anaerolineae bacterium]